MGRILSVSHRGLPDNRPLRCATVPSYWRAFPGSIRSTSESQLRHLRLQHRTAFALPFQHQPVSRWPSTKFGRRCAAASEANWCIFLNSTLNVEDLNVPLPPMQGVADIEKLLLPMQLELVQNFGASLATKAVALLPMDPKDITHLAAPPQNGAKDVVEVGKVDPIGHRDKPDHHWADMAK